MTEKWGNGHYTCYGCSEQDKPENEQYHCSNCFTYTPLMQGYYKNWTNEEKKYINTDKICSMTENEVFDLIINGLKEISYSAKMLDSQCKYVNLDRAIDIVNQVANKYRQEKN